VQFFSIAIDGPAGSGKSTIAKKVASDYNILYLDTGAMYRALAYYCIKQGKDTKNEDEVLSALDSFEINIEWDEDFNQVIKVNGEDVTVKIRTNEVSFGASNVAKIQKVRENMVSIQQGFAQNSNVIMDGRDIGTAVLPNAKFKFFLTASVDERTRRRYNELKQKGTDVDYEQLKNEISKRDYEDMNRIHSPLKKAEDAIEVDTTSISIFDVVTLIESKIKNYI
jgi:cytidylate kinase